MSFRDQSIKNQGHNSFFDYSIGNNKSYFLGNTIGKGTFGKVKLGTHILTKQKVISCE